MTSTEFAQGFDILYNNIMSNQAPPINGYEKSVLLTQAEYEILKNHINPKGNKYQEGVDDSYKRQIDIAGLTSVKLCTANTDSSILNIDSKASLYCLPTDYFIGLNEVIKVIKNSVTSTLQVVPLSYNEYSSMMKMPYNEPNKKEAWRLINSTNSSKALVTEIKVHTGETITSYILRYIRKPKPIIVEDISVYNQTVEGLSTITECELDSSIHQEILQRAVELAKVAYEGDISTDVQIGGRSE